MCIAYLVGSSAISKPLLLLLLRSPLRGVPLQMYPSCYFLTFPFHVEKGLLEKKPRPPEGVSCG